MNILLISILSFFTSFTPPGTKKVKGTDTYMDVNLITNIDWREHLHWQKNNVGQDAHDAALPNPGIWGQAYGGSITDVGNHDEDPVVGITYDQVMVYCKWRSKVVSQISDKTVAYYLPSTEDFTRAQEAGSDDLCSGFHQMTSTKGVAIEKNKACGNTTSYTEPSTTLSFRCIARIVD